MRPWAASELAEGGRATLQDDTKRRRNQGGMRYLPREGILRRGGDSEFDGCWPWRADAKAAGGVVEHLSRLRRGG